MRFTYNNIRHFAVKSWGTLLDVFFPPLCLHCKSYLDDSQKQHAVCQQCLESITMNSIIFRPSLRLTIGAAGSYADPVLRTLIHYYKYEGFTSLHQTLGRLLVHYIESLPSQTLLKNYRSDKPSNSIVVVPIPLHPSRLRKRGFNQAELLARFVSGHFTLTFLPNALQRTRNTKSQMQITDYRAREANIRQCFAVSKERAGPLKDKHIILVDDVYTSGATMHEAVKVLKQAGAQTVVGLVIALAS